MLTAKDIAEINAIFHEYPKKVASIAQYIFFQVPYEEAVYAVYTDGIQPYGLKKDIIEMYDKEVTKVKKTRSLPWVQLSIKEDIRDVCDFVQRHINDGTFELHEKLIPTEWVSLIDGKIQKPKPWTEREFRDWELNDFYGYSQKLRRRKLPG